MSDPKPLPAAIASLFDLRRASSRQDLLQFVGAENLPQFETSGKPFVVVIVEGPSGGRARLEFDDEPQVVEFYRTNLKSNMHRDPKEHTAVIPRHIAPDLLRALHQVARDLALENTPTGGSA